MIAKMASRTIKRKKRRNIGETGVQARPSLDQAAIKERRNKKKRRKRGDYFFLPFFVSLAAAGFSYFVVNVLSIVVRAPLAESANGPLGFRAKYFSSASLVPSAGMTLPSGVTCALPSRYMPY